MMSSPPDFPPLAEMNQNKHIDIDDCIINLTGHLRKLVFLLFLVCSGTQAVCLCAFWCTYRRIEKNSFALVSFMCKHNTGPFLKLGEVFVLQ